MSWITEAPEGPLVALDPCRPCPWHRAVDHSAGGATTEEAGAAAAGVAVLEELQGRCWEGAWGWYR